MFCKLTYFSLAVASISADDVSTYDEQNLFEFDQVKYPYIDYYQDESSEYRVPGWMKKAPYGPAWLYTYQDVTTQNLGYWNSMGEAVSLGNGRELSDEKEFIDAVKNYQNSPNGYAKTNPSGQKGKTPFATGLPAFNDHENNDPTNDPWDHIENFWIRDGHLFALILDDRANEMIHGGVSEGLSEEEYENSQGIKPDGLRQLMQTDVYISDSWSGNGERIQRIVPMDYHMEHLREFCNYMGGDLWAPSSQAEYDDLMEREGGVCDKHQKSNYNLEIYLNIHREGYLRCPNELQYKKRLYMNFNGEIIDEPCPSEANLYGNYGTADRHMSNDRITGSNDWRKFMTTDPWFAEDINGEGGMCMEPDDSVNEYAYWDMNTEDPDCQDTEAQYLANKPYIKGGCFKDSSNHRFQKFVESDIHQINKVNDKDGYLDQLQNDCVVATCTNDVDSPTGPIDDRRAKSAWNMANCNLQRHTGICRIRAFGCNPPTYYCKDKFHRYCGSRSVYTRLITDWASESVSQLAYSMQYHSDMTNLIQRQYSGKITDVMFASTPIEENDIRAHLAAYVPQFSCDANLSDVEVILEDRPVDLPTCECKCTDESCREANGNFKDIVENFLDIVRGQGFSQDMDCFNRVDNSWCHPVGIEHFWECTNELAPVCDCYRGHHSSQCVMISEYEAAFRLDPGLTELSDVCVDNCCPTYDNSMWNSNAFISAINGVPVTPLKQMCMKRGDEYTVRCNEGDFHMIGNPLVTEMTFTVPLGGECYHPFSCQEREPPKCCPAYENDTWNINANLIKINGQEDYTLSKQQCMVKWETYTVRCNEGYISTDPDTDVDYLFEVGYADTNSDRSKIFVGDAMSYKNCVEMVREQYPDAKGASVRSGGIGRCYAEIDMEYVVPTSSYPLEIINFKDLTGSGIQKTFRIENEDECFKPFICEAPSDQPSEDQPSNEPTNDQITNKPEYNEMCNAMAEIYQDSYCKLFQFCHFESKKNLKRCAKTCDGTLELKNWPEEGCGKKMKLKKQGKNKFKVCKKGKNKKKKDCVKLIN